MSIKDQYKNQLEILTGLNEDATTMCRILENKIAASKRVLNGYVEDPTNLNNAEKCRYIAYVRRDSIDTIVDTVNRLKQLGAVHVSWINYHEEDKPAYTIYETKDDELTFIVIDVPDDVIIQHGVTDYIVIDVFVAFYKEYGKEINGIIFEPGTINKEDGENFCFKDFNGYSTCGELSIETVNVIKDAVTLMR